MNLHREELLQAHLTLLQSTNAVDVANAASALQFFGPRAVFAVPRLIEIIKYKNVDRSSLATIDWKAQFAAIGVLKATGADASAATPALAELLPHNIALFNSVSETLAKIGPKAAEAIPVLRALLATDEKMATNIRGYSPLAERQSVALNCSPWALALVSIDPSDSHSIAMLRDADTFRASNHVAALVTGHYQNWAYSYEDPRVLRVSVALWKLGLESDSLLDHLIPRAQYDQGCEAELLGEIGPAAKKALPVLEERLKYNRDCRRNAALAITQIDPEEARRVGLPGLYIICQGKRI